MRTRRGRRRTNEYRIQSKDRHKNWTAPTLPTVQTRKQRTRGGQWQRPCPAPTREPFAIDGAGEFLYWVSDQRVFMGSFNSQHPITPYVSWDFPNPILRIHRYLDRDRDSPRLLVVCSERLFNIDDRKCYSEVINPLCTIIDARPVEREGEAYILAVGFTTRRTLTFARFDGVSWHCIAPKAEWNFSELLNIHVYGHVLITCRDGAVLVVDGLNGQICERSTPSIQWDEIKVASSAATVGLVSMTNRGIHGVICSAQSSSTSRSTPPDDVHKCMAEVARMYFKYGTSTASRRQILQPRPRLVDMERSNTNELQPEDRVSSLPSELLYSILTLLDNIPFRTINDPLKSLSDTNQRLRREVQTYRDINLYLVYGACKAADLLPNVLTASALEQRLQPDGGAAHIVYLGCVCGKGCVVEESTWKGIIVKLQHSQSGHVIR